jgi:hypothetical protein
MERFVHRHVNRERWGERAAASEPHPTYSNNPPRCATHCTEDGEDGKAGMLGAGTYERWYVERPTPQPPRAPRLACGRGRARTRARLRVTRARRAGTHPRDARGQRERAARRVVPGLAPGSGRRSAARRRRGASRAPTSGRTCDARTSPRTSARCAGRPLEPCPERLCRIFLDCP